MHIVETNKAFIASFLLAVGKGDAQAIMEAYAPDGYCETMGRTLISGRFSRDQIASAANRIFDAFPAGVEFEILTMTAEDDRVAVEAISKAVHVSGQPYSNHYHFLFQLRDGKIAIMKEFMDTELVTDIICSGHRPASSDR
jgi:ketosteroid isomerase-like protein